ncbi:MAG: FmdB family transcriptional regulator [Candidatus Eremiobacteraeota bacterium]|nr:FmdB family transcriptional regulator [Candidatus Eremiobacteraeota bacterium]
MPLYEYRCPSCEQIVEIRHGFDESQERACAACGSVMARVFSAAPIVFKGSGFYVTDSRGGGGPKASAASRDGDSKETETKSGEAKGGETKPAEPKDTSTESKSPNGKESAA